MGRLSRKNQYDVNMDTYHGIVGRTAQERIDLHNRDFTPTEIIKEYPLKRGQTLIAAAAANAERMKFAMRPITAPMVLPQWRRQAKT